MRATLTRYEVLGWGTGELWTAGTLVLAHDFDFRARDTLDAPASPPDPVNGHAVPAELVARFESFFSGADVSFADVELDLGGWTAFQQAVAGALRQVQRGEVITYGELAAIAGYPGAQRAVGTFCARNRFPVLIPCHRVVASAGIGSYGSAGIAVKRRLLVLEGVSL